MSRHSVEFNWRLLGGEFAEAGDDEQAEFLLGFAEVISKWKPSNAKQIQFACVRSHIEKDALEILIDVFQMLWKNDI